MLNSQGLPLTVGCLNYGTHTEILGKYESFTEVTTLSIMLTNLILTETLRLKLNFLPNFRCYLRAI